MDIHMQWLGVAGFEFRFGNYTLLVDPFLTKPALRYVFGGRVRSNEVLLAKSVQSADFILVTHAHFDHLMDVPEIAQRTGARVIGSPNVIQLLQVLQVSEKQIQVLHSGEILPLPFGSVQAILAKHPALPGYQSGKLPKNLKPPLRLRDYRMDDCFSYLITIEKFKLLVWSSTSIENALPADAVFLRAVASADWYRKMIAAVRPRLIIPTHWDDMFQPIEKPVRPFFAPPGLSWPPIQRIDLERFTNLIKQAQPSSNVLIPERLHTYQLMEEMYK